MITNPKEQKICDIYSQRDGDGYVHCFECPLRKGKGDYQFIFNCKANSHYNRKTKEWEYDEE